MVAGRHKSENLQSGELTDAPDRRAEVFMEGYGNGGWLVALSDK